jgi:hypothetical protein
MTLFRESESGKPELILPGTVVRTGDGIRVHFELGGDGFAYLFIVDGYAKIRRLFQVDYRRGNLLAGMLWIPSDNKWLELDENAGVERLLAAAATHPIAWLEELGGRVAVTKSLEERARLVVELEEGLSRDRDTGKVAYVQASFSHE